MKKPLSRTTIEKETLFWAKVKNTLDRDDIKVCRK